MHALFTPIQALADKGETVALAFDVLEAHVESGVLNAGSAPFIRVDASSAGLVGDALLALVALGYNPDLIAKLLVAGTGTAKEIAHLRTSVIFHIAQATANALVAIIDEVRS